MAIEHAPPLHPVAGYRPVNNLLGIGIMALAFFFISLSDVFTKLLTDTMHPLQLVWVRLLGLFVGVIYLVGRRGIRVLHTRQPGLQILRGLLIVASGICFIMALANVPIATVVSVTFVAPFLITAMGAIFLGEAVGARRWVAISVGFIGTLIVIRPGLSVFHPTVFLALLAATAFATRQIVSRVVSARDATATTMAYTALTNTVLLFPLMFFVWTWPEGLEDVLLLLGVIVTAALAELLMIRALEVTRAVVVAPVQYSTLIWAVLFGFLVFGNLPDLFTILGAGIVVSTGLYVLNRERVLARRKRAEELQG